LRFFFDNNIAPRLARGFRQFVEGEHDIIHLRDRFPSNTPDVKWMKDLAEESNWIILSGDVAISRNPHEIAAWKEAGHTIFFLKAVGRTSDFGIRCRSWPNAFPTFLCAHNGRALATFSRSL
jgi:hypothetical protein